MRSGAQRAIAHGPWAAYRHVRRERDPDKREIADIDLDTDLMGLAAGGPATPARNG